MLLNSAQKEGKVIFLQETKLGESKKIKKTACRPGLALEISNQVLGTRNKHGVYFFVRSLNQMKISENPKINDESD